MRARWQFLCIGFSRTRRQLQSRSSQGRMTAGVPVARSAVNFSRSLGRYHEGMSKTKSYCSAWRRVWHDAAESGSESSHRFLLRRLGGTSGNIRLKTSRLILSGSSPCQSVGWVFSLSAEDVASGGRRAIKLLDDATPPGVAGSASLHPYLILQ